MNIISCPECGSKFDVSTFEPGSDFPCTNCRHVLKVPGEAAATESSAARPKRKRPEGWGKVEATGPVSVPGSKPAIGPKKKTGPSRAAPMPGSGGRPATPARGRPVEEERPSRRRDRREREPAARSSSTPLLLGLGGLGLVVIIVVVAMVAGGGGDGDETDQAKGSAGNTSTRKKPVKPEVPTDPAKMTVNQRLKVWRQLRLKAFSDDADEAVRVWRENYEWATRYKMKRQANEALEAILKKDPQNEYANEKRGNKKFEYPFMPDDLGMEDFIPFEDKHLIMAEMEKGKGGEVWVSEEKHAELTALLNREKEHRDKLASDVRYKWTKFWINAVKKDPGYDTYAFEVNEEYPPYLVFVQDTGKKLDRELTDRLVRRNGLIFKSLFDQWTGLLEPEIRKLSQWRDFKFPSLGVTEGDNPPILKVWVFLNKDDFRAYLKKIQSRIPDYAAAYYSLANQWITLYEGGGGSAEWHDRQTFNNNKVFHEGAHQLHYYYTKLIWSKQRVAAGDPPADFEDIKSQSFWFSEGVAEMFGGADELKEDAEWICFKPLHTRIRNLRQFLNRPLPGWDYPLVWSLEEIAKIENNATVIRKWLPRKTNAWRNPNMQSHMVGMFYAQAWTFCHFLWNAEGGRYRKAFVEYFMKEMTGQTGWKHFQPIIQPYVDEAGGWKGLEKKVIDYLGTLPTVTPSRQRPK